METIKGTEITSVTPHYEHVYITVAPDAQGNYTRSFYISSEDLVTILSEFEFQVGKKRTRRWGKVEINDYRIERFDEPRTY
jgi:hypothetical protein